MCVHELRVGHTGHAGAADAVIIEMWSDGGSHSPAQPGAPFPTAIMDGGSCSGSNIVAGHAWAWVGAVRRCWGWRRSVAAETTAAPRCCVQTARSRWQPMAHRKTY